MAASSSSSRCYFLHVMIVVAFFLSLFLRGAETRIDYKEALHKAIVFFQAQRSGQLIEKGMEIAWRGDSALKDGQQANKDLSGGYYDAGDNEKFNLPMAFTTTMLSWSAIDFGVNMGSVELENTRVAIRWATDYLLKCASDVATSGVLYVGVGDGDCEHICWERPEDIDGGGAKCRTVYSVSPASPGSEVAGETAAALAAASIVFRKVDRAYSSLLLKTAKAVFDFAMQHQGSYPNNFYKSYSGFKDELVWGAAWLFKATKNSDTYGNCINNLGDFEVPNTASWDNKYAAASVLMSRRFLSKKNSDPSAQAYSSKAENFICLMLDPSIYSKGGLMYVNSGGSNLQYVTVTTFLMSAYSKYTAATNHTFNCGSSTISSSTLKRLARKQVDYILGKNPNGMSYMVGYGTMYPQQIHHRGSSLPSIKDHKESFGCRDGYSYLSSPAPNPNLLMGAVVGGPDKNDQYQDDRSNFGQAEPTTYINAPLVGTLAYLAGKPK